ncbi:DUF1579 domain-containing protein [Singulisphaera sp. Ch08]|uniref:DUF1579 domain-containing protein n=1 Tax=Singulisphaera sp. Ch08 TaxID=3120278 RepID=A0AAU7CPL6_9BACT
MFPGPQKEHNWLDKFVGEWTSESECSMGPDQPLMKTKGVDFVRSIGGLWIVAEGEGQMPGGESAKSIMTIGYDPQQQRYVGTFIASMMSYLWIYNGSLDAAEKVLTLDADGPDFTGKKTAKYKDRIEFVDDNHRILTSQVLGEDGTWTQFMTVHYRRKP